jgi:hypothetical protein
MSCRRRIRCGNPPFRHLAPDAMFDASTDAGGSAPCIRVPEFRNECHSLHPVQWAISIL